MSCLLLASSNLGLGNTTDLLGSVLSFLLLLSASLGLGLNNSLSNESILGLELLGKVHCVVDEGESGGLATSEVSLEPEGEDSVGSAIVHLGELLPDVRLADGGLAGVEDVDDHLPSA